MHLLSAHILLSVHEYITSLLPGYILFSTIENASLRPLTPHHRNSPTLQLFEIPPFRKKQKTTPPDNNALSHATVNQNAWNVVEIPAFKHIHQSHQQLQPQPQPQQHQQHQLLQTQPSPQQHPPNWHHPQQSSPLKQQQQQHSPQPSGSLLSPADMPWTTEHFKEAPPPKKMHAGLENCLRERVVHRSVDDLPIKVGGGHLHKYFHD